MPSATQSKARRIRAGRVLVSIPLDEDPLRGTGRTTGLMLIAIGNAMLSPDQWITFRDHFTHTTDSAPIYASLIKGLCKAHGFKIDVQCVGGLVRVRSPLGRLRRSPLWRSRRLR